MHGSRIVSIGGYFQSTVKNAMRSIVTNVVQSFLASILPLVLLKERWYTLSITILNIGDDMDFNPVDPSNILLAGAGPQIRKITQLLIEKYPALYDYANVISVVLAFIMVGILSILPAEIENWIKIAIAISGVTSVYSDWRGAKKAVETKDTAIAIDTAPNIVPESKGGLMPD